MRGNRRWLLGITVLLWPLLAVATTKDAQEEITIRWDIIRVVSFPPPTVDAGGQSSALAEDLSKITLTGSGTFVPAESEDVTGGGRWEVRDSNGNLTGSGTYEVKRLIRFDLAPGRTRAQDKIGNAADSRAGLAFLRIDYSDGSKGILAVSCHLAGGSPSSPHSIFEGITASKGFVDFWSRVAGGLTLFHVVPE